MRSERPLVSLRHLSPVTRHWLVSLACLVTPVMVPAARAESNTTNIITGATNAGGSYFVGQSGQLNYLEIRNGGGLTNGQGIIGYALSASNNLAVVTGSGSRWINTTNLFVGFTGPGNRLTITNSGYVKSDVTYISNDAYSTNDAVLITGTGSRLETTSQLFIGYDGSGNRLTVTNGGQAVCHGDSFVGGFFDTGSGNTALVTGSNSTWTSEGDLYVGYLSGGNQLIITNGGRVTNQFGYLGAFASSDNKAVVTGTNSVWRMVGGYLSIGGQDSLSNQLTIANAALVTSLSAYLGNNIVANGNQAVVTGANSRWNVAGDFYAGYIGSFNQVSVQNGGQITNDNCYVGYDSSATGNALTVTGANSRWTHKINLYVGYDGSGNQLSIANQGQVNSASGYVGASSSVGSSSNAVVVTDAGSQWNNSVTLEIGYSGEGNRLILTNGGKVVCPFGRVGTYGDFNLALVTGTNSQWLDSGDLYVGNVGVANLLRIENGGLVTNVTGYVGAFGNDNIAQVTGAGSQWQNRDLYVGYGAPGNQLIIQAGALVRATNVVVGFFPESTDNLLSVLGASLIVTNASGNAWIEVRNGTLLVSNATVTTPTLVLSTNGVLAGVGTVTAGYVTNHGIVSPGLSPGRLTISTNYVQTASGALNIELAGTSLGTNFDLLAVNGTAHLAGTLNVTLTDGFYPATNASFTILTAGARSNTFATFNYPSNDVGMTLNYTATNVTLRVANVRPVIAAISDQTINELAPFSVPINATDADSPAQILIYALTNSPAGASINSGGVISWTPTEAQGPSTNSFTVRVTDNGTPNLTAVRSFQVVVNEVNVAPVITVPGDQTVLAGMTLSVHATATDADVPANALTFALASGPPGLSVSAGGLITWPTSEANAGTTNPVNVRVFDNGVPSLNDTRSLNVIVVSRPLLLTPVRSGTNVLLMWTAIPGATYRVEFNINLNATNWDSLAGDVTAVSNTASKLDLSVMDQRFYRVRLVP